MLTNAEVVPILKKYHSGGIFDFMGFTQEILAKAKPIIIRDETERIIQKLDDITRYVGSYEATINSRRAISLRGSGLYFDIDGFIKALKGGKNNDNKDSS